MSIKIQIETDNAGTWTFYERDCIGLFSIIKTQVRCPASYASNLTNLALKYLNGKNGSIAWLFISVCKRAINET